jgi:hypothetical protein
MKLMNLQWESKKFMQTLTTVNDDAIQTRFVFWRVLPRMKDISDHARDLLPNFEKDGTSSSPWCHICF